MQQTLKQLKRDYSLKIEKGMQAYWASTDKVQELDPNKYIGAIKGQKAFAVTKDVLGFISDKELFITPNTKEALRVLRNNGYKEYNFFVPLSPSDMSFVDEKLVRKWQQLVDNARSFSLKAPTLATTASPQLTVATA